MKQRHQDVLGMTLYYTGIFFVLREWLLPIMQLTGTGYQPLFLLFIALALVLNIFQVHVIVSWALKLFYICWFTVFVYRRVPIFSSEAWSFLWGDMQYNVSTLMIGQLSEVTDSFRTTLFFVLIWMIVYLIHYWVTVRMSIFYFFGMTVFFIAALDTFSPYDGKVAIVRVVVIGLLMTGLLYIQQIHAEKNFIRYARYALPLFLLVGVSSAVAYMLPKAAPMWPDPVPFIHSVRGGEGVSQVGYGEDEEELGGGFIADDTVSFTALVPERQYWRVESKDTYTSKGWIQSENSSKEIMYEENTPLAFDMPIGAANSERVAHLQLQETYPFVIYPYGAYRVATDEAANLVVSDVTNKISTETLLTSYEVVYRPPTYNVAALMAVTMSDLAQYQESMYLQLPETLPERVKELALSITADDTNVYDKVRAIEGYFARAGFRYETENIAVPNEQQDYVDQFLFETQVGYCDNFSTSMAVMLRAIGIPTRWVKGFAPGEQGQVVDGVYEYIVTNNDAHSWVEVYFPGVGWMPFEPTIGFSNTNDMEFELDVPEQNDLPTEPLQQIDEQTPQQDNAKTTSNEPSFIKQLKLWFSSHLSIVVWAVICVFVIIVILWIFRRKWLPKVYVSIYRKKGINEMNFEAAYRVLLKQLALCGLKRQPVETLSQFAKRVDAHFATEVMCQLTVVYEQYVYSQHLEPLDFHKLKESWEYLINRTGS